MKSIFVPVGGSASDEIVFATALALARPVNGHLRFFHVHMRAGQGIAYPPHTDFASGAALRHALDQFEAQTSERSVKAIAHVREFCARANVSLLESPATTHGVTASWHEESTRPVDAIIRHARHCDAIVMARATTPNGLPPYFIEHVLTATGRPVIIPGTIAPQALTRTIMVCWRETPEAARALMAAQPLLLTAERVVVAHVPEDGSDGEDSAGELVKQLLWSGVRAEAQILDPAGRKIPDVLAQTAKTLAADLIVMGAYGHSRLREIIFGGCTQSFIEAGEQPVLLMH